MKPSQSQRNDPHNPQPQAVSQQSPRLEAADCTATNSGTHAGENVPIAGDTGMHSAAQRNAIPEANVRKTVANGEGEQSQTAAALNQDEQECMEHILAVMHTLCEKWGLREGTNLRYEMCLHVHGLQGFVQQHMLQRIAPDQWGHWYTERDT